MHATHKGKTTKAHFTREELWALTETAGKGEQYAVVHLRVNGSNKLEAAATDGKCSVEAIGKAEGVPAFELAMDAAHLTMCKAAMKTGMGLVVEIVDGRVKDAIVVDSESGENLAPIGWHHELDDVQLSMAEVVQGLRLPDDQNYVGSWFAVDPGLFSIAERIRVATDGCPVTFWGPPPGSPHMPVLFAAVCDRATWKGSVVPEKVIAPGGEADEPPQPDETAPGRPDRQVKLDLEAERGGKDTGVGDGTRHDCPGFDGSGCGFTAKAGHELCPACESAAKAKAGDDAGGAVIDDEEAERIKAAQSGKPAKKTRRKQKSPAAGSR